MLRHVPQLRFAVLGTCLALVSTGCSSSASSSTRMRVEMLCSGDVDECRKIELSRDLRQDREAGEPERKYEELRVVVRPRERLHFERMLKTIELKFGVPRGQCRFENVEGRIDQTGQKVWFVQRDTGRIIATVDLYTGKTTGPDDEPPAWATPNGGKPLPPSAD